MSTTVIVVIVAIVAVIILVAVLAKKGSSSSSGSSRSSSSSSGSSGLQPLSKIVVALGAMSSSQLREIRAELRPRFGSGHGTDLVEKLIDLYLKVGDDPSERARVGAALVLEIEKLA